MDEKKATAGLIEKLNPEEVAELGNPGETTGAADRIDVQDENPYDFAESQSDNREVISPQPQGRNADRHARYSCGRGGGEKAKQE